MKIFKTLFALAVLFVSTQAVSAISIGGYEVSSQTTVNTNAVACTMEAMLCPDGVTYVGRTGPKCEFAPCPTTPVVCLDLKNDLRVGSTDATTNGEVTKLQSFLFPQYLKVEATGRLLGLTRAASVSFQKEYGISPAFGYIGALTRAKIKELTCDSTSQNFGIKSITPSYAKVGDTVVLSGPGLNSGGDYVLFNGWRIETDGSKALNRVGFVVPQYISQTVNCIMAPCPDVLTMVNPGNYTVQVVNNLGKTNVVNLTVTNETTVPPNDTVKISWVAPTSAKVGTRVIIYGYNLFRPETKILFDGYSIPGTPVYNKIAGNYSSALEFVVPETLSHQCNRLKPTYPCLTVAARKVTPGTYELAVENKYGRDFVKFEVLGDTAVGGKPYLTYSNPTQGPVGTEVYVFGTNLNTGEEKVYFGGSQVSLLTSATTDRKGMIRFKIPEYITPCGYDDNTACRMMAQLVTPGKYEIIVKNKQGLSNTLSFTVTASGTTVTPKLKSLTPSAGGIGTEVAITGEGINVGGDQIYFGGSLVPQSLSSSADTVNTLRFRVPEYITPCGVGGQNLCKIASRQVVPGSYEVVVVNSRGTSNTLSFTVTSSTSNTPTISSISGPQALNVNQQGTWTVNASHPTNGNLSYSVVWGDETSANNTSGTSLQTTSKQTATFTHIYSQTGVYTPRFTVTNANGQSVSASLSVNVGNVSTQGPKISSMNPSAGTTGIQVVITGTDLNPGSDFVWFGGVKLTPIREMKNLNSLTFSVPESLYQCTGTYCPDVVAPPTPLGSYEVKVENNAGMQSNSLNFQVTGNGSKY